MAGKGTHLKWIVVAVMAAAGGYAGGRWQEARRTRGGGLPGDVAAAVQKGPVKPGLPAGHSAAHSEPKEEPKKSFPERLAELVKAGKSDDAVLFSEWAQADGEAALAAFLADPKLQNAANASGLFSRLASKDPARALALLDQMPRKPWNADAARAVASGWVGKDAGAAMAAGLALPPGAKRRAFLAGASEAWLRKDIVAAAAWMKALPEGESVRSLLGKDVPFQGGQLKSADQMSALMEIHRLMPGADHTWLWHDFSHWSSQHKDEAVQWALALPDDAPKRAELIKTALERVGTDREKALALLPTLTNPKDRAALLNGTAENWGRSDPEEAWKWAGALGDEKERASALQSISRNWASTDPEKAVAFLEKQQPDQIAEWGPAAASAWGASAPDEALAWLGRLPEGSRERIAQNLLRGMTPEDPGRVLENLNLISNEQNRRDILKQAAGELAKQEITLASGRVSGMPPGPDRDAAIQGMFEPAFEVEPDSALIWANSISNENARLDQVSNGFHKWLRNDPVAAEAWLKRTPVEAKLQSRLAEEVKSAAARAGN